MFNSLDEATQEIFLASAQEAAEYERAWVAEQEADQLAAIKSHGVEVIENPDVGVPPRRGAGVYDAYPQYADYIAAFRRCWPSNSSRLCFPSREGRETFLPFQNREWEKRRHPHGTQENPFPRQRRA